LAVTVEPVEVLPLIDGGVLFVGATAARREPADATPTMIAAINTAIPKARPSQPNPAREFLMVDGLSMDPPFLRFC
jgi:hypothetical protein